MNKSVVTIACAAGLAVMLSACGSSHTPQATGSFTPGSSASAGPSASTGTSPSTPAGSSSPGTSSATVPAGYHRVGGSAQGISLAVPATWVTINLAKDTMQQAAQRLGLHGVSATTLIQDMQTLQKDHAVIVYDVKAAVDSAGHFATNLNAYCVASGVTDTGSSAVPILRQEVPAEFQTMGATHITMTDVMVGGIPGLRTSFTLVSAAGTLYEGQLEVLPKAGHACFVTLTGSRGYFPTSVLSVAAATATFPG